MDYAYDSLYLQGAQRILGDTYDYAVNTLNLNISEFQKMFLVSNASKQFENGNPTYIAGMNGCELAKEIIYDCTGNYPDSEDIMYLDKSPEYWIGWSLAYYQWNRKTSFKSIEKAMPIDTWYGMYATLHEADISLFVEIIDEKFLEARKESTLKRLRAYACLTQRELAASSGVALRQIQLFEQGYRDIGKCQGDTLKELAQTLHCSIEELIQ